MKIRNRVLVIMNSVMLVVTIFANYVSSTGQGSTPSVADISHKYDTLFAPAGYAFAIWGLIYLACIGFVVYQWVLLNNNDPKQYIMRTGNWFAISCLANTFWLLSWTKEQIGLSVLWILLLLVSLCVLVYRLRLELDDEPVLTIMFIWWPLAYYLGWIMVATIACIASWFVSLGWNGGFFSEASWTIIMIVVACFLYLLLTSRRNLRESASVGIWAFVAIAVRQWGTNNGIVVTAIIASVIILIVTGMHGARNKYYSPFAKIKRGEWK